MGQRLSIFKELKELILACWQRSKKWTIIFWAYIILSVIDNTYDLIVGHGLSMYVLKYLKKVWEVAGPFLPFLGG